MTLNDLLIKAETSIKKAGQRGEAASALADYFRCRMLSTPSESRDGDTRAIQVLFDLGGVADTLSVALTDHIELDQNKSRS